METKSFIHESDLDVREWVRNNILVKAENIDFYNERFSVFDGEYEMGGKKYFLEIKNRHFNHDKYTSTIIEKFKWSNMSGTTACLCVLFDDGVLFYTPGDLRENLIAQHEELVCPNNRASDNSWSMKKKECVKFLINESRFFSYEKFDCPPGREIKASEYN